MVNNTFSDLVIPILIGLLFFSLIYLPSSNQVRNTKKVGSQKRQVESDSSIEQTNVTIITHKKKASEPEKVYQRIADSAFSDTSTSLDNKSTSIEPMAVDENSLRLNTDELIENLSNQLDDLKRKKRILLEELKKHAPNNKHSEDKRLLLSLNDELERTQLVISRLNAENESLISFNDRIKNSIFDACLITIIQNEINCLTQDIKEYRDIEFFYHDGSDVDITSVINFPSVRTTGWNSRSALLMRNPSSSIVDIALIPLQIDVHGFTELELNYFVKLLYPVFINYNLQITYIHGSLALH